MSLEGIVPWGWAPDWSVGVREWLAWLTDVLPAERGQEQRRALRVGPRHELEFRAVAEGQDRAFLENALWRHGASRWAVPLWQDAIGLGAPLAEGATAIPVDPAGRQFAVGEMVMLLGGSAREVELAEVTAVGAEVTISAGTARDWPAGSLVVPARAGRLAEVPALSRFSGDVGVLQARFALEDPAAWADDPPAAEYRGLPVLEELIDWADDPAIQMVRLERTLDGEVGPVEVADPAGTALPLLRSKMTLLSRQEVASWRARLFALRGRQGSIWIPSWAPDLVPVATVGSASVQLDVAWCGVTDLLSSDPMRRDLRLLLADGTVHYRRVVAATELSADVERLTLDSALGVEVAAAGFGLVSWLTLARQETDIAELAWWSGDVVQTSCSFRGFRHVL